MLVSQNDTKMKRRPVKRLHPTVVNRIAAGEVVKRPANALKEMLENSLDAEATSIQVVVKDGGMKFLQIQDNGIGINKDDLPVVCERFTTSKLESFDDLRSINTYGFRGEALSSISHVASLTITTKTDEERCGYKAIYVDGKMNGSPTACGANRGTQITVENMFYNVPTRRKMLKNFSEEFSKIRDVVNYYAIHNSTISFSLKKYGRDELHVKTVANSTCTDNIRSVFGNVIARDLMEAKENDETLQLKFHILCTSLDYHASQLTFLLFINHRLVDAEGLRRELDLLYGLYLPQGKHPFMYISLEMAPENVDVNVHPTKHSVFYLHEEAINKKIRTTIQQLILSKQGSRNFTVQVFSPASLTNPLAHETSLVKNKTELYPYEKVRVDAADQKIDRFLQPLSKPEGTVSNNVKGNQNHHLPFCRDNEAKHRDDITEDENTSEFTSETVEEKELTSDNVHNFQVKKDTVSSSSVTCNDSEIIVINNDLQSTSIYNDISSRDCANNTDNCDISERMTNVSNINEDADRGKLEFVDCHMLNERREFSFTSLQTLRKEVIDDCDQELKRVLRSSSYVGCLEYRYMLMQHSTNLYLCDIKHLCEVFFYQVMLCEFGNFGVIKLSQPLSLTYLLKSALKGTDYQQSDIESLSQQLMEKSDMLEDYFSIKIDEHGNLLSFPWLLQKYHPSVLYFPEYILKLAKDVKWEDEQSCFQGICRQTSWFYSQIPSKKNQFESTKEWNWTLEHILFPQIKKYVYPPKCFIKNLSLCHITRFKDLFTVFERC